MATTRPPSERARGRMDVTDRSVREVRSFAAAVTGDVHVERRGDRTYLVTG